MLSRFLCGHSSVVERNLAKVDVARSNRVTRLTKTIKYFILYFWKNTIEFKNIFVVSKTDMSEKVQRCHIFRKKWKKRRRPSVGSTVEAFKNTDLRPSKKQQFQIIIFDSRPSKKQQFQKCVLDLRPKTKQQFQKCILDLQPNKKQPIQ